MQVNSSRRSSSGPAAASKARFQRNFAPKGLEAVYIHRQSRTLSEILVELLRSSNNYIANQVFLEIGGHRLGGPVSLDKSLRVAREILAEHNLAVFDPPRGRRGHQSG